MLTDVTEEWGRRERRGQGAVGLGTTLEEVVAAGIGLGGSVPPARLLPLLPAMLTL